MHFLKFQGKIQQNTRTNAQKITLAVLTLVSIEVECFWKTSSLRSSSLVYCFYSVSSQFSALFSIQLLLSLSSVSPQLLLSLLLSFMVSFMLSFSSVSTQFATQFSIQFSSQFLLSFLSSYMLSFMLSFYSVSTQFSA